MVDVFEPTSTPSVFYLSAPMEGTHYWVAVVADGTISEAMVPVPGARAGSELRAGPTHHLTTSIPPPSDHPRARTRTSEKVRKRPIPPAFRRMNRAPPLPFPRPFRRALRSRFRNLQLPTPPPSSDARQRLASVRPLRRPIADYDAVLAILTAGLSSRADGATAAKAAALRAHAGPLADAAEALASRAAAEIATVAAGPSRER